MFLSSQSLNFLCFSKLHEREQKSRLAFFTISCRGRHRAELAFVIQHSCFCSFGQYGKRTGHLKVTYSAELMEWMTQGTSERETSRTMSHVVHRGHLREAIFWRHLAIRRLTSARHFSRKLDPRRIMPLLQDL